MEIMNIPSDSNYYTLKSRSIKKIREVLETKLGELDGYNESTKK